jgi:hypothetical protein
VYGESYYVVASPNLKLEFVAKNQVSDTIPFTDYVWYYEGNPVDTGSNVYVMPVGPSGTYKLELKKIGGVKEDAIRINIKVYDSPHVNFETLPTHDGFFGFDRGCEYLDAGGTRTYKHMYVNIANSPTNHSDDDCLKLLTLKVGGDADLYLELGGKSSRFSADTAARFIVKADGLPLHFSAGSHLRQDSLVIRSSEFIRDLARIQIHSNGFIGGSINTSDFGTIVILNQAMDTVGLLSVSTLPVRTVTLTVVRVLHNTIPANPIASFRTRANTIMDALNDMGFNQTFVEFDSLVIDTLDVRRLYASRPNLFTGGSRLGILTNTYKNRKDTLDYSLMKYNTIPIKDTVRTIDTLMQIDTVISGGIVLRIDTIVIYDTITVIKDTVRIDTTPIYNPGFSFSLYKTKNTQRFYIFVTDYGVVSTTTGSGGSTTTTTINGQGDDSKNVCALFKGFPLDVAIHEIGHVFNLKHVYLEAPPNPPNDAVKFSTANYMDYVKPSSASSHRNHWTIYQAAAINTPEL